MKKALIVIDVQNYFMNEHTHELPKKIAMHLENNSYDTVAFTKFVNSPNSSFQKIFGWKKCANPPEIDIVPELQEHAQNIFEKNGFSAFKSSKLLTFLHQNDIQEVYLCGTDTEACVLASALEAFELGFHVHVLHELCASHHGQTFHNYGKSILERNLGTSPS